MRRSASKQILPGRYIFLACITDFSFTAIVFINIDEQIKYSNWDIFAFIILFLKLATRVLLLMSIQKYKDFTESYTTMPDDPNNPEGIRKYFQKIIDVMPNNVYWLDKKCNMLGV